MERCVLEINVGFDNIEILPESIKHIKIRKIGLFRHTVEIELIDKIISIFKGSYDDCVIFFNELTDVLNQLKIYHRTRYVLSKDE